MLRGMLNIYSNKFNTINEWEVLENTSNLSNEKSLVTFAFSLSVALKKITNLQQLLHHTLFTSSIRIFNFTKVLCL